MALWARGTIGFKGMVTKRTPIPNIKITGCLGAMHTIALNGQGVLALRTRCHCLGKSGYLRHWLGLGICHDSQDRDFTPKCDNLAAIKEQATCSPLETRTSYSDGEKLLLKSLDVLINLLVTPLIAEDTTIILYFFL